MARRWPLALRPRTVWPAVVGVAATLVLGVYQPGVELYLGGGDAVPRVLGPLEYGPMLVGLMLSVGLAPRFGDWDQHGARCTRRLAVATLAATLMVPLCSLAVTAAASALRSPVLGPGFDEVAAYASNAAVAAALAFALVGTVGRLGGTVGWAAATGLLLYWQASAPSFSNLLPFTAHFTADGDIDAAPRWGWIVLLLAAALYVALVRRSVPLGRTARGLDGWQ